MPPRKKAPVLNPDPERVFFSVPVEYRALLLRTLARYPLTVKRIGEEFGNEPIYLVEIRVNGHRGSRKE